MIRARQLGFMELVDIVTQLQEAFYLDTDERGNAIWDPDSEVNGGDLVETMGVLLRKHELCPEEVLLATPDLTAENLYQCWQNGNRKAVARVMSERTRSEIAAFTVRLAGGPGVEEAGMFAVLMEGQEVHSRKHDNKTEIDKSRRELMGSGARLPSDRSNGEAFRDEDDE